jgi:hypothetical protein
MYGEEITALQDISWLKIMVKLLQNVIKRLLQTSLENFKMIPNPDLIDALLHQESSVTKILDAKIKIVWSPYFSPLGQQTITSMQQGSIQLS